MYVPRSFAETDVTRLHALMQSHSFATLVSDSPDGPVASHLPLLLEPDRGPHGALIGHFARANNHWQSADGRATLAIFHGPHAYISPRWYAEPRVVPTWNYVAVHATGVLRVIDDAGWLRGLVSRMVDVYEAGAVAADPGHAPWRMESQPDDFLDQLLAGIVGFEIRVDSLEGKWKLSQNHTETRRERVIAALQQSGDADSSAIAALIQATLSGG